MTQRDTKRKPLKVDSGAEKSQPARNLPRLIERQADRNPDRVAVVDGGNSITYAAWAARVAHVAARIAALDPPPAAVAIDAARPVCHWLALLAALRLGIPSLSIRTTPERALLDRLKIGAILSDGALFPTPLGRPRLMIDAEDAAPPRPKKSPPAAKPSSVARFIQSSGTTGSPKIVALTWKLLADRLETTVESGDIDEHARVLTLLGPGAGSGLRAPLRTWLAGGTVVLPESPSIEHIVKAVADCNILIAAPASVEQVLARTDAVTPGADRRLLMVGGGRLPTALRDRAQHRLAGRIKLFFGTSEAGRIATGDAALLDRSPAAVGFAVAGARIEVVDDHGHQVPAGAVGRIRVKTKGMAKSYLDNADATDQHFQGGWCYPGDLGSLDQDGLLALTGRTGDTLNIGGAKLSPTEIEDDLRAIPGVADAAAVHLVRADGSDVLALAVVVAAGADRRTIEAGIAAASGRRPRAMTFYIAALPRNDTGKPDRQRLTADLTPVLHAIEAKTKL